MNQRYLYGDAELIQQQLNKLELVESSEGEWAAVYKDAASGEFWLKYYSTSGTQGGGYLMLVRLPVPGTENLIKIATTSVHEDEAVAAVLRLLDEEAIEKKDFRLPLVEHLDQLQLKALTEKEKKRLMMVIKLSSLDDPMNRKSIDGKSVNQIQNDADYFARIAARAKQMLELLS